MRDSYWKSVYQSALRSAIWAVVPSLAFGVWQGSAAAGIFAFFVIWPVWIRMER